jgi:type I restriction enzyme M protein
MPGRKRKAPVVTLTTASQLGGLIKSARDIMRKDKGLSTDLDRLPMLTWIMFLKFLDDMEQIEESKAKLRGEKYRSAIEPPYRWRDWAASERGMTGRDLLAFINQDEATLPTGKRGPGLFAHLRGLRGGNGGARRRHVIATVFSGVVNRMTSGYLLRDVLNKVSAIHFLAKDDLFTLGHLYESMLKEMRDAAGENGEFYTPRPLVQFMVKAVDPRLGETVLDPACGTGGFLVEAYHHLEDQARTVADRKRLQTGSLFGGEAKPLPYLLCQMNLLLHGLEVPQIDPANSLRFKLTDIGDKDRVDVILTNPPFGGEEERGILGNFPPDKQTAETTVLFIQLIMRKLRRSPKPGRAAVVVSDGFLSTKGVAARVKEELLSGFNLHTVLRLPRGVFVPYTPIATNVLFFDRSGPTKEVWYYQVPGPTDRQTYSKTKPFKFAELADCLSWWNSRRDNPRAWRVKAEAIAARDYDLDIDNPSGVQDLAHRHPGDLLDAIDRAAQDARALASRLRSLFSPRDFNSVVSAPIRKTGDFLTLRKNFVTIIDDETYRLLTVQLHGRGIRPRGEKLGAEIKTKKQQVVRSGDLVVAEIDAKVGGFGLVPPDCAGAIVSSHYFVYEVDATVVSASFFEWWLRSGIPEQLIQPHVKGATNYAAIRQHHFPLLELRLPESIDDQVRAAADLTRLLTQVDALRQLQAEVVRELDALLPSILDKAFRANFDASTQSTMLNDPVRAAREVSG